MGRFRYYMCPEGLIAETETTPQWGLLWVDNRGGVKAIRGAVQNLRDPGAFDCDYDLFSETLLLANLLHRVGDAERLNQRLREADRLNRRLQGALRKRDETIDGLRNSLARHILREHDSHEQADGAASPWPEAPAAHDNERKALEAR